MAAPTGPLAQLVTITASDGLMLPTLYFQPLAPAKRAVIWLHGMGSSGVIYSPEHTNALAEAFIDRGIAFIAMQNRGAGMLQSVKYLDEDQEKQKRLQGTSHELIADCVHDIDGAVAFAKSAGHTQLYLGGHSTGANKTALYNYLKPDNAFAGYILYGGGDDTGQYYEEFGKERFEAVRAEAEAKVEAGQGTDLAPFKLLDDYFSYQSIADILDPDGGYDTFPYYETVHGKLGKKQLWREVHSIFKPTLVVYGEQDAYAKPSPAEALEIFKQHVAEPAKFTYELIPGADHGSYGHEADLAKVVADWVAQQ
jgi:alpha-beta hydrolase superfamily lysophospholipase